MMRTTKLIAALALSACGSVEVQQDLLSISMTTTRDGADAGTVQTQLKQALDTALAQARQAAIPEQMEVRTGNFSLYPRYNKDGKINGWQGSTELVLEGKDFPRITSTAGKIQTLTMGNVSFALSREPGPDAGDRTLQGQGGRNFQEFWLCQLYLARSVD